MQFIRHFRDKFRDKFWDYFSAKGPFKNDVRKEGEGGGPKIPNFADVLYERSLSHDMTFEFPRLLVYNKTSTSGAGENVNVNRSGLPEC